ncbi:MAG TPA: hypothetical protein VLB80_03080 [Candidatus Babeliales bacterium]|nr:hypothetical protein [Candidatus Babeliales bacterium]
MKSNSIYLLFITSLIVVLGWSIIHSEDKTQISDEYPHIAQKVDQKIEQQNLADNDVVTNMKNFAWRAVKVVGTISLISYIYFASASMSGKAKLSLPPYNPNIGDNKQGDNQLSQIVKDINPIIPFVEEQKINEQKTPLTEKEIERLQQSRNVYLGISTWVATVQGVSLWLFPIVPVNPLLIAASTANALASVYYHTKILP